MEHVVVGVDRSESSKDARRHAADLARTHAAEVTFVSAPRDRAPEQELARLADVLDADLVVVGSHGRSGLQRLLHGSIAESTIHATRRPVLVARGPAPGIGGYRRVLAQIGFSRDAEDTARIATRWTADGGRLELFHPCPPHVLVGPPLSGGPVVRTAPERILRDVERHGRRLVEQLRDGRIELRFGYATGPVSSTLLERESSGDFDLVVVRDSGETRWRRWLAGNVPEQLVRQGSSSVLVLPRQ